MVSATAKQIRGHHGIESERPSSDQGPYLSVCRIVPGNLAQTYIAARALVLLLTQLGKQRAPSAAIRKKDTHERAVFLTRYRVMIGDHHVGLGGLPVSACTSRFLKILLCRLG